MEMVATENSEIFKETRTCLLAAVSTTNLMKVLSDRTSLKLGST